MALDRGRLALDGRQINIRVELLANQTLGEADLTGIQAQALLYLLRHPEMEASVTALHRATGHSKATVSRLIKQLREKGYVRVEVCPGDDRRRLLYSTEKGKRLQSFLEDSVRSTQDVLYRGFTPGELSALDHLQKKMLRNLSAYQSCIQEEASTS